MLTIERIKKHLNIDAEYTGDDTYLGQLLEVARQAALWQVDTDTDTEAPAMEHAQLLLIGELYKNREITGATAQELPKSYNYLLGTLRKYSIG